MAVHGCSLCHHSFCKLRDMPLPSPLITGCIHTSYYNHSTQSLYVQKAPGQAPGLVMQLKEGLEISRILLSTLYTEINSRIMLIMRSILCPGSETPTVVTGRQKWETELRVLHLDLLASGRAAATSCVGF